LLAEAALAPVASAYEESGLSAKPKKRTVAKPKIEEVVEVEEVVEEEPAPKAKKAKKSKKAAA